MACCILNLVDHFSVLARYLPVAASLPIPSGKEISGALQATGQRHRLARAVGKRLVPYWVVDIEGLNGDGLVEAVVMPSILSLRNVIAGAEVRRYFL
jgi:hypothetical protein